MKDESGGERAHLSRRQMVGALGASLVALPSLVITESAHAAEPEKRIIAPDERNVVEMQRFIEDCVAANKESDPQAAVTEVLARGVSEPRAMLAAVGEPTEAGL